MLLQFVGADHQVTGSCHYVEACDKRFVVDYGMEQGTMSYESKGLPCNEAESVTRIWYGIPQTLKGECLQ